MSAGRCGGMVREPTHAETGCPGTRQADFLEIGRRTYYGFSVTRLFRIEMCRRCGFTEQITVHEEPADPERHRTEVVCLQQEEALRVRALIQTARAHLGQRHDAQGVETFPGGDLEHGSSR